MKRYIALFLALVMALLLCGCGAIGAPEPTPTPTPTPEPTPTPTPRPAYENPLNGELMDEPYTGRVFGVSICNTPNAVPHIGLNEADVVMEMFVNHDIIRNLALYSNIRDVEVFGSVRSTRLMFHQLTKMYDLILLHSGGGTIPLDDIEKRGLDNFNIDHWNARTTGTSYRDEEYDRSYEASLFGVGEQCYAYAESKGKRMEQPAGMDYGLNFADEGTPAEGETADNIKITFDFVGSPMVTEMKYDSGLDKYVYWKYDQEMHDLQTEEAEAFKNVVVIFAKIHLEDIYQVADFKAGGQGWYACGGKLIPITWSSENGTAPLEFFKEDGTPLEIERGNTYIAIAPDNRSQIEWQ